jgi:hypothetical protein
MYERDEKVSKPDVSCHQYPLAINDPRLRHHRTGEQSVGVEKVSFKRIFFMGGRKKGNEALTWMEWDQGFTGACLCLVIHRRRRA